MQNRGLILTVPFETLVHLTLKRRFFDASCKISKYSQFWSKKRWIITNLINKGFLRLYLSQRPLFTGLFLVSKLLDGPSRLNVPKYSNINLIFETKFPALKAVLAILNIILCTHLNYSSFNRGSSGYTDRIEIHGISKVDFRINKPHLRVKWTNLQYLSNFFEGPAGVSGSLGFVNNKYLYCNLLNY